MPVNSVPFVVVGFIEGQIEVWNLQETEAAKPAGEPSRYSLKLVPGDYVQPQLDSQLVVMQPVCVKATKNGNRTHVACLHKCLNLKTPAVCGRHGRLLRDMQHERAVHGGTNPNAAPPELEG